MTIYTHSWQKEKAFPFLWNRACDCKIVSVRYYMSNIFYSFFSTYMKECTGCHNKGMLLIRLWIGITIAIHGAQGVLGWTEGRIMRAEGVFGTGLPEMVALILGGAAVFIMLLGGVAFATGAMRKSATVALGIVFVAAAISHFNAGQGLYDAGGPWHAITLAVVFFGLMWVHPGRYALCGGCTSTTACATDTKKMWGCCGGGCHDHEMMKQPTEQQ